MGKKGTKRKTRWRVLPIGEDGGSGSGNDDDALVAGNENYCADHYGGSAGTYSRATQQRRRPTTQGSGGYYNNKQHYHPRSYGNHETNGQPLVTTEKQIFNEEEYTKITTPRQDVLFKKGYLGRKKPTPVTQELDTTPALGTDDNCGHNDEIPENEHTNGMMEDHQQYIYNGFVDQSGVYYINGSGYEMYDPYTGQITVIVGPHYGPNGGPPVLAAVPCQPVPLQPLEWFNPPGFLPYVQAPACQQNGLPPPQPRDRRKRYSTDSQNCSPQSSESTGPPGSPQESDEVAVNSQCPPVYPPHQQQAYVYPGYMFGAPMYNMNGVTVQSTPNQAPSSDVGKRRKKKRRRRRRRNGVEDGSEESSSDEKEPEEEPTSLTSQESSLESDSKLSLSGEESNQPAVGPPALLVATHTFQTALEPPPVAPEIQEPPHKTSPEPTKPPPPVCNGEIRLVNGHGKPKKREVCNGGPPQLPAVVLKEDVAFESYEDFEKCPVEEEWITVKAKPSRKVENGEKLTNGKAGKDRVNGVNNKDRNKDKLYKNHNGKVESVPSVKKQVECNGKLSNGRAKVPIVSNKMDGNERSKSESIEAEVPPKPGRKEKKKVITPPKSPQTLQATAKPFEMPSVSLRHEVFEIPAEVSAIPEVMSQEDSLLAALMKTTPVDVKEMMEVLTSHEAKMNMPKVPSLKDLSSKSIPKETTTVFLEKEREDVAPPIAPPRRKKWRATNKRIERAATPGKTNDDSLEESSSSSSSSSQESEESVIECLSSGLNSPEVKNVSSSDDEVIYSGKLGVEEPEVIGTMKSLKTPVEEEKLPVVTEVEDTSVEIREIAKELVDTVIDKAVEESTRLKQEERPITQAVTRWLRSQSPDVLSVPEEEEEEEESEDESDDDGSKNLLGNPLPASSVECVPSGDRGDVAGGRVANKHADNTNKDYDEDNVSTPSTPSGEWDLWDCHDAILRHAPVAFDQASPTNASEYVNIPEAMTKYDPLANDTFSPIEGSLLDTPDRCTSMCDPSISVAKYYVLGPLPEKTSSPIQDIDASDSDDPLEEYRNSQGPYKISLATELARLEQPLPKSWAVTPLSVEKRCNCKCQCKEPLLDSGVESGDEGVVTGKRERQPSVFKRKVTGRLTGEGTPFPCGGICCIVQ